MRHRLRQGARSRIRLSAAMSLVGAVATSACSASTPGILAGGLMTEYAVSSAQSFNTPGQGRVEFLADGKVVASVIAKAQQGSFRLSLPPGRYTARWPGGKTKQNCSLGSGQQIIEVRSGEVTRVTLLCPTSTLRT